ncbi:TadA family conjugal transfer-associated ATPase [Gryllotalpicola ginsengisoli]|uniref:TadA family conjugal transfer-associated ATPase n=1 Tax=Gryllotalpicola ginsengisoli TaxID=444608 RepID=UPI0003B5D0D7|nr:TadA family conjugal transfer-associated ATPase [Gryllotalpicola ginsengisoli]
MTDRPAAASTPPEPFVPRRGGADMRSRGGPVSARRISQARADAGREAGPPIPFPGASGEASVPAPDWSEFGALAPYLALPAVTDVLVASDGALWLDEGAGLRRDPLWRLAEDEVRALAVRLVALGGRHVDEASPIASVRVRDGVRVHVVLPPISTGGTVISIRVPRAARLTLDELAAAGMMPPAVAERLREAVAARQNLLIAGATGSGKTTLLSALLSLAAPDERIVVVEDVAELRPAHPHVVSLEARQPNLEGAGGIGLARLVREALRMRPDRLVVGECRGAEVRELFGALNTGHDGGAGTLHANSLADVPARIEALGALAGLDDTAVARQAASAVDLVVQLDRRGGRRRVAALGRLKVGPGGRLEAVAA